MLLIIAELIVVAGVFFFFNEMISFESARV